MKTDFNWGDDIIDSRDIIARHEELQEEYNSLVEALEEAESDFRFKSNSDESPLAEYQDAENKVSEAQEALDQFNQSFEKDELDILKEVISQGEESSDWSYGEGLIHESYFTEYTEQLVNDCWEMPKQINEGKWPWNHFKMDWEAAAEELKGDYSEIIVQGETYFIRS